MIDKIEKDKSDTAEADISRQLQEHLDKHGFSFQYSLLKKFEDLRKSDKTSWVLEGSEIPISSGGSVSHIDFVLRNRKSTIYLIGECKRADPARSHWCFANAPYTWRGSTRHQTQFDKIFNTPDDEENRALTSILVETDNIKEIGFELKTRSQGDGVGSNEKSAINSAVSQVLRNSSGFINYLLRKSNSRTVNDYFYFIPVIFTTAKIFITKADISSADLETGYLPKDSVKVEPRDWIWFNHNRSINLSHGIKHNIEDALSASSPYFFEFTRSVAIVSPAGVDSFMQAYFSDFLR